MKSKEWKISVYAALVAFALWSIYLYAYNRPLLKWITHEDSISESVSAICYLVAACIFFIEWIHGRCRNIFVLGYALLFLVVGGEEISWGQRIIGMQTPDALKELNVQKETNLHNIDGIHQHIRAIGVLVVLTVAVLMPLTDRWIASIRELYSRLSVPIVQLWTLPLTILALSFMVVPRVLLGRNVFSLDEVGELYLSFVFLIFAIEVRARRTRIR
jgi:hypothetical protein